MLTPEKIAYLLLRAKAYRVLLVKAVVVLQNTGVIRTNWSRINVLSHMIQGLEYSLSIADYVSDEAIAIFNHITECVGSNVLGTITTDPDAQPPGSGPIVIINNPANSNVQSGRYDFVDKTVVDNMSDYQGDFAAIYGNNPFIALWTINESGIGYTQDTATVPDIEYVNNDIAQGIESITWTYPQATTGYIQILGIQP